MASHQELQLYAGIRAALDDGHPEEAVLAQEGTTSRTFASLAKEVELAAARSMRVRRELAALTETARDCLGRKVAPYDVDAESYAALLLTVAVGKPSALQDLGLRLSDLDRLGRIWQRKIAVDPSIGERLLGYSKSARLPTETTLESPKLRPFPWTTKNHESPAEREPCTDPVPSARKVPTIQVARASYQIVENPQPQPAATQEALEETLAPCDPSAPSLPFRPGAAMPPPAAQWETQTDTGTLCDTDAAVLAGAATLPFDVVALRLLRLDTYVDLVRQLRASPNDAARILGNWGLGDLSAAQRIHALWQIRFDKSPELKFRFAQAVAERSSPGHGGK